MNSIVFLGEWGLRSAALVAGGTLLVWALRVKDPAVRLAAWTAMLVGSLAIPLLAAALPKAPVAVTAPAIGRIETAAPPAAIHIEFRDSQAPPRSQPFDWRIVAMAVYVLGAGTLLLRLAAGLAMSRRLLCSSRPTERPGIRESDTVPAPVVLGILRPAIVLPSDWREWDAAKLDAVIAHEHSHVRRNDPLVQLLSAVHRALVWHSPASWFLHRSIVRAAEDASDDAAVAATRDRASYAEVLLQFMQGRRAPIGVGMARYSKAEERIHRILDSTVLSRGLTGWRAAAIIAIAMPVAWLAAAAAPQDAPPAPPAPPAPAATPAPPAPPSGSADAAAPMPPMPPDTLATPDTPATPEPPLPADGDIRRYIVVLDHHTMSGSWNSSDSENPERLREKYGDRFAWFLKTDGSQFVITDKGVLEELEQAMAPQRKVNELQNDVNQHQHSVNTLQSNVNSLQNQVNTLQHQANQRQDIVNQIQSAASQGDKEALMRQLEAALQKLRAETASTDQKTVNQRQASVNAEQSKVNDEQQKVNEMQHKVNEEQQKVNATFHQRISEIFNSAIDRHLAQRLM